MTNSGDKTNQGSPRSDTTIELWIPPGLNNRVLALADKLKIAPLTFLRKSVEVHQVHRYPEIPLDPFYFDKQQLKAAYDELTNDPNLKQDYDAQLSLYMQDLSEVEWAELDDPDPRSNFNFMVVKLPVRSHVAQYVESYSTEDVSPDEFKSVKEIGIAAILELVFLYTISEVQQSGTTE